MLDNLANTGCPKKSDFQNAAGAAVHRLNQWWPAGKIVIHAQDLRILKSLGFEDPQILKMYLGINGLFPD